MINRPGRLLAATCLLMAASWPAVAQSVRPASADTPAPAASSPGRDAAEASGITQAQGLLQFDYQVVPIAAGRPSVDLLGFHVMTQVTDGFYLGIGGHTPLFKGEYGGFMVFDATAHVQRRLFGNVIADAGVALGGGGGGKSVAQSRIISGTGGFIKAYAGLGYAFKDFTIGANVSKIKFVDSAINHTQLSLFVQTPFSYAIGPFGRAGQPVLASDWAGADPAPETSENMLSLGLDNIFQIDPKGANKADINLGDLQFSHFMTPETYWYFNAGAGYRGRPLYNQVFGGLGYRSRLSPTINLYAQLGVGSGGYAPEVIDTGPGLLLFPKVAAEYMITPDLGLTLSAGYLAAPKASSRNYTIGAALNYHIHSGGGSGGGADLGTFRGYRLTLFQQTEFNVRFRNENQSALKMLSIQMDKLIDEHLYIPLQVSGSYGDYLGFPGYGELVAGVGWQTAYRKQDRFQYFAQLLLGANVHGPVIKPAIGLTYNLSDKLAIHAVIGQTLARLGSTGEKFRSDNVGLGLSYRFSVPTR